MSDESPQPVTAQRPKPLNSAVQRGAVTLHVDTVKDIHDMPGVEGTVFENLFVVLGHEVGDPGGKRVYMAGTAEVKPGSPLPAKGELWTFAGDKDGDSFPTATRTDPNAQPKA